MVYPSLICSTQALVVYPSLIWSTPGLSGQSRNASGFAGVISIFSKSSLQWKNDVFAVGSITGRWCLFILKWVWTCSSWSSTLLFWQCFLSVIFNMGVSAPGLASEPLWCVHHKVPVTNRVNRLWCLITGDMWSYQFLQIKFQIRQSTFSSPSSFWIIVVRDFVLSFTSLMLCLVSF